MAHNLHFEFSAAIAALDRSRGGHFADRTILVPCNIAKREIEMKTPPLRQD